MSAFKSFTKYLTIWKFCRLMASSSGVSPLLFDDLTTSAAISGPLTGTMMNSFNDELWHQLPKNEQYRNE